MRKLSLVLSVITFIGLSGCSSNNVLETRSIISDFEKNAHLVCAGDYTVLADGTVTNSKINAFDKAISKAGSVKAMHKVAQNNLFNHIHCIELAKGVFERSNTHVLTDSDALEYRKIFLLKVENASDLVDNFKKHNGL